MLRFLWYRSSHPDPRKSPKLLIWPHHLSDTASQPSVCLLFSCWEQKIVRWCQIRIRRVINQFKATITPSSHCNHRLVCRSIVLVKQDSLRQFTRPFWNFASTTFQSPELLIQCGCILQEQCIYYQERLNNLNLMHAKFQLLWHNSFLVSLWTFHPTLVYSILLEYIIKNNELQCMNIGEYSSFFSSFFNLKWSLITWFGVT